MDLATLVAIGPLLIVLLVQYLFVAALAVWAPLAGKNLEVEFKMLFVRRVTIRDSEA